MKVFKNLRAKIFSAAAIGLAVLLPTHFALAAWWNPFSWTVSGLATDLIVAGIWFIGLFVKLIAWFASWITDFGGKLLQMSIEYTVIGLKAHLNLDFIKTIYQIVLNFSNTFFIFVIIYIAMRIILDFGDYRRKIVTVLITAFLVNFSFLFTTIVIDASNIVATGFYNRAAPPAPQTISGEIINYMQLSGTDMDAARSTFVSDLTSSSTPPTGTPSGSFFTADETNQINNAIGGIFFDFLLIFFYAIAGYTFFSAAFLFIGRYVAFIFLIILSPIAFASYAVPALKGRIYDKWWDTLFHQAFVAPVFLFFLYIAMSIIRDGNLKATLIGGGAGETILNITLFFAVVIGLLNVALSQARSLAEYVGSTATSLGAAATLGSAAVAGKVVGGKIGKQVANSERLGVMATKGGITGLAGRSVLSLGNTMHTGTWDARNSSALNKYDKGALGSGQKSSFKSTEDYLAKSTKAGVDQGYGNIGRAQKATKEKKEQLEEKIKATQDPAKRTKLQGELKDLETESARLTQVSKDVVDNLKVLSKKPTGILGFESTKKGYSDAMKEAAKRLQKSYDKFLKSFK